VEAAGSLIAEHVTSTGRESGERRETFVLHVVSDASGLALRSHAEHPRSGASADWRGWSAAPFADFVAEHAVLRSSDRPGEAMLKAAPDPTSEAAPEGALDREATGAHVPVRVDAGYVVGGSPHDFALEIDTAPLATLGGEPVDYAATLEISEIGSSERRPLARRFGQTTPGERLPLLLSEVPVPRGVHRVELVVDAVLVPEAETAEVPQPA
jgi:hypothetical protein